VYDSEQLEEISSSYGGVYELDKRGEHDLAVELFFEMTAESKIPKVITSNFELSSVALSKLVESGYSMSEKFIYKSLRSFINKIDIPDLPLVKLSKAAAKILGGEASEDTSKAVGLLSHAIKHSSLEMFRSMANPSAAYDWKGVAVAKTASAATDNFADLSGNEQRAVVLNLVVASYALGNQPGTIKKAAVMSLDDLVVSTTKMFVSGSRSAVSIMKRFLRAIKRIARWFVISLPGMVISSTIQAVVAGMIAVVKLAYDVHKFDLDIDTNIMGPTVPRPQSPVSRLPFGWTVRLFGKDFSKEFGFLAIASLAIMFAFSMGLGTVSKIGYCKLRPQSEYCRLVKRNSSLKRMSTPKRYDYLIEYYSGASESQLKALLRGHEAYLEEMAKMEKENA